MLLCYPLVRTIFGYIPAAALEGEAGIRDESGGLAFANGAKVRHMLIFYVTAPFFKKLMAIFAAIFINRHGVLLSSGQ